MLLQTFDLDRPPDTGPPYRVAQEELARLVSGGAAAGHRRAGRHPGGMGRRHLPARPAVTYGTGVRAGGGAPASSPLRSRLRVAQSEASMAVPRITTTTPSVIQTGGS
jgi:hypothetical protein